MNKKKSGRQNQLGSAEDLIENFPLGLMILDKNGKIIKTNRKQEEISQIGRETILGKTFQETFPKTLEQGLKRPYFKLLENGIPFDVIIDKYTPQYNPIRRAYHARGAPLPSKKYFILINEHEDELFYSKRLIEKRTEELLESKKFLESLIDSSPNIVISTDLNGRILIFNKRAEKIFGYTKKDVEKKKIDFLFKNVPMHKGKEGKNSHATKETLCLKKDQTTFPASLLISDVNNARGKIIAKLYLLSDLTEKKEMEERLLLSEKLAQYTELMGGIAHQLNNPLIGVINFSEMLLKEIENQDPKRELVETISKAGKDCLKIITSVLNSIKDPHLTFSRTDINEVLMNSLDSLKEQFRENLHNIEIITKIDTKISSILGDSIQLKQCFLNIMTNGIQAMQNGGYLSIETRYDERKKLNNISFSDNGIGFSKEFESKIFLPFFSLQKIPGRHGLGLSFAYQIVRNHGGNIYIESEVGKGSTFTVSLPAS